MDTLAWQCIAGGKVTLLASSPPALRMRRTRSCILTPFPAQKFGAGYAILVQRRPIQPLSSSSFSAAASTEVDVIAPDVETPELNPASELTPDTPVETTDDTRTVHVRFVLQKECSFGQQFFLVGNDPMCGLWDPSKAVPLEWSSGHVWTAELDLPVEREIQYKFIRKGPEGKIKWQDGRDRSLQTWETTRTIVVSEDWQNPEHQKVAEEEEQLLILVEEEEHTEINIGAGTGVVMDPIQILEAKMNLETAEMNSESKIHEEQPIGEGGLLLVPDMGPISASGSGLESSQTVTAAGEVAEVSLDEVEHCKSSQSSGVEDDDASVLDASQQSNDGEKSEEMQITGAGVLSGGEILAEEPSSESAYALQNDIHWCLQALQQVLTTLGLTPA